MGIISKISFVLVDTATIAHFTSKSKDASASEIFAILSSGSAIPVLTHHTLEEIACHECNDEFQRRMAKLAALPHIAYPRSQGDQSDTGTVLDVREKEISYVLSHPTASHDEIVDSVKPTVIDGFTSGEAFVNDNLPRWEFFRTFRADEVRHHKERVANISHFKIDDPNERIPERGKRMGIYPRAIAAKKFDEMAKFLEGRIATHGDVRNLDPKKTVGEFMAKTFSAIHLSEEASVGTLDLLLDHFEVSRDRLPARPTSADVGYEAVFVAQMNVHAARMRRRKSDLLRYVRKEALPSWQIWQEIDGRLKNLPNAEIGNLNDKHMAAFGLYVDIFNADKRIADVIRQAAAKQPIMKRLHDRIPKERGPKGLLQALKKL